MKVLGIVAVIILVIWLLVGLQSWGEPGYPGGENIQGEQIGSCDFSRC